MPSADAVLQDDGASYILLDDGASFLLLSTTPAASTVPVLLGSGMTGGMQTLSMSE